MPDINFEASQGLQAKKGLKAFWFLVNASETWGDTPIQSGDELWVDVGGTLMLTISVTQADGNYKLLVFTDLDAIDTGIRSWGDTYLELDVVLSGVDIFPNPETYDWSIYISPPNYAFFDEFTLWDEYTREEVKNHDVETNQIKVNGEEYGQFARFNMVLSRALARMINFAQMAKKSSGYGEAPEAVVVQKLKSAGFPLDITWAEDRKKILYEDSLWMNKFAGNVYGLRAIAYRLFAWIITDKTTFVDLVFMTNNHESFTYDEVTPIEDMRVLFDGDIHAPLNGVTYTVDVQLDADFLIKKDDFEAFMRKYIVSDFVVVWEYINTP